MEIFLLEDLSSGWTQQGERYEKLYSSINIYRLYSQRGMGIQMRKHMMVHLTKYCPVTGQ